MTDNNYEWPSRFPPGRIPPASKDEVPTTSYAFWAYDKFPYVIGGEVTEFLESPHRIRVRVKGYGNSDIYPFRIIIGKLGAEIIDKLKDLTSRRNSEMTALQERYGKELKAILDIPGLK